MTRGLLLSLLWASVWGMATAQEVLPGEKLVRAQCMQCHTLGKGEPHGVGPNLFGIIGRKGGAAEGFSYSEGYRRVLTGKPWDTDLMDRWLTDTQSVAPGNGMTYFQDNPRKRKLIVDYLSSLK
ncbi:MAG TPA: c-type cytochrome [Methylibium sp.]|nr:c-type cytochrome [Methylibium sp.]